MKRASWINASILLLVVLVSAAFGYRALERPRIDSVLPASFSSGEAVTLRGKNFGSEQENRKILLDDSPLTQSSYLSWSDEEIVFLLPPSVDSGLIQVSTPLGTSNPEVVISSARLPGKPSGILRTALGPSIMALEPSEAAIGSLVEIEGINFGSNVQFSQVKFSRNAAGMDSGGEVAGPASPTGNRDVSYVEPEYPALMYERWDDKNIAVRVPEGAGSGTVSVSTPQGESQPFTFRVTPGTGTKYLYAPAAYSVQFKIRIRKKDPKASATLVLYVPNPADSFSQSFDSIQEQSHEPYLDDYGQVAVLKIDDFPESEVLVARTALVTVYGVETDLDAYRDSFSGGLVPPFLDAYVKADSLVPAREKEILNLAAKVTGKEKNLQKKAVLIRNWLAKSISWKAAPGQKDSPLAAIKEGAAGSRSYALLAAALLRATGLPAIPISGFLVRKDGVSVPHFWLEYYLPAVGWIPWDPVLALGEHPLGFDAGLEDPADYFGSLDNRHIAISRGLTKVAPLLGGSDLQSAKAGWSFQTLFEESLGGAYSSSWQEIEILASY